MLSRAYYEGRATGVAANDLWLVDSRDRSVICYNSLLLWGGRHTFLGIGGRGRGASAIDKLRAPLGRGGGRMVEGLDFKRGIHLKHGILREFVNQKTARKHILRRITP